MGRERSDALTQHGGQVPQGRREWEPVAGNSVASEALRGSEEAYRDLVESLPALVCRFLPDCALTFVNERYCSAVGQRRDALLGSNLLQFVPPQEWDRVRAHLSSLTPDEPTTAYEYQVSLPGREPRWQRWSCRGVFDQQGQVVQYQGVGEDITAQKRMEEEVRQGQKMEALGRLAGRVAHDFNNLLTTINGYSQVMLRRLGPDDPHHAFVQEIMQAGERAASLSRQLLLFSRREAPERRPVDLNELVGGIVRMLERVIGEEIEVVTRLDPQLRQLEADPGHVQQMVLNLAMNARDAMPQGGVLTLKTENVASRDPRRRSALGASARFVHLLVADTGTGMDDGTRSRIFEPFFSTKEEGTGLGLAVVYGIVQEHGGWIDVDSAVGEGTSFHVYFPALDQGAAADEAPPRDVTETDGGSELILLVEDDPDVRALVDRVLSDQGYSVLLAGTAREAVSLFEKEQERIGLVFTDVVLPDGSGLELAQQLLGRRAELPILVGTGYLHSRAHPTGLSDRAITVLQKPYDLSEVLRAVREALGSE